MENDDAVHPDFEGTEETRAGRKTTGAPKGFPRAYRDRTPIERASWLAGEECGELVRSGRLQPAQVQAEFRRLNKAAAKVGLIVPSPCRLEEYWCGRPFPPPAENTPMRRARHVLHESERLVLWPASYLSGAGATYDVIVFETEARRQAIDLKPRRGESSDGSPSAAALAAIGRIGAIADGMPLLTEDEAILKQQIDRYLAGKPTSLLPNQDEPRRWGR